MTAPPRTTWGLLSLIEDPPLPDSVNPESVQRPISEKVPRSIALHGESTFVGRVRKAPQSMPQTQIFLPYVSSSHCCFLLRRRAIDGAIEAAVKDTSSNGTFVNGAKLGKRNVSTLKAGDEIALYQPQGPSPLGMPIVYRLELHEQRFPQAIDERTEKVSGKQADAPATPARKSGGAGSAAGSKGPAAVAPPNGAREGGGTDPRASVSTAGATTNVNTAAGKVSGGDNAGVAGTTMPPNQRQAGPGAPFGSGGNGTRAPLSAGAGTAGASSGACVGAGAGAPFSPDGSERSERSVFAMMDDQNAIRKAAEAEAQRRVQVERDGLLRQIRVQGARLEEANKNHQELLSKNNGLQEQLAEAESSGSREQERAAHLQDLEHKMKKTMEEMESQRKAAVADAAQQRSAAEATDRAAAEERAEFETAKSDLQAQVNGLVEKNVRHESRMADLVEKKLALEKEVGELRVQVAEVMGTRSGLEAQLKEARDSEHDIRARLTKQEQAYGQLRQEKAEVEGKLAQRDRELKASEDSRERLEMCSEEARKLSLELREIQAALCQETQELEQTKSLLDEERFAREAAEAGATSLKVNVAELSSETQRLQKLLEEARKEGQQTKDEADAVREQLKQARKAHRLCEAQLSKTRNELERMKNRKEGVAVEALMRGRNLKKAKRVVQEISKSLNEQLAVLLGHLEVPGEGVVLDSQGGLGAGSVIGDCTIDDDELSILHDNGRAESSAKVSGRGEADNPLAVDHARDEEEEGEQFDSTQMSPSAAKVGVPPGSPSAAALRPVARFPRIDSEGVVRSGEITEGEGCELAGEIRVKDPEDLDDVEAQEGEGYGLTDEEEVRDTQDDHEQEGKMPEEDARAIEAQGAQMSEYMDDIEKAVEEKERRGATEANDAVCNTIRNSTVNYDQNGDESSSSITISIASLSSKPPTMATLAEAAVDPAEELPTEVATEAEAVAGVDAPLEVKQRLEEDLGDQEEEEKCMEDDETEFTVPSLNFSRGAEVPEARVSGPLGERDDERSGGGGVAKDASEFARDGNRSALDGNMSEDDGGAEAETEHTKVEIQKAVEGDVEAVDFQVASPPEGVGGGCRKRGREKDDDYNAPTDYPDHAEASGARLDRKKPKAASESTGGDGGSHDDIENIYSRASGTDAMHEGDMEIREYDGGVGAIDPTQYDVSNEDIGRGKVEAAKCDTVENLSSADETGIDGKKQYVPDGEKATDLKDENREKIEKEEEKEEGGEDSEASCVRRAAASTAKGLGGQCGIAIDLSQDDSDETGEDEYF